MTKVRFDKTFVEEGVIIPFRREHQGKNRKQIKALKAFTKLANARNRRRKNKSRS